MPKDEVPMAQSSVAREPTMEEILASIRRIIESNDDTATHRPEPRPKLESIEGGISDGAAADAGGSDGSGDLLQADEALLETAVAADPAPEAPKEAPQRTVSLADVAARLRDREGHEVATVKNAGEAPRSTHTQTAPAETDPAGPSSAGMSRRAQPLSDTPERKADALAATPVEDAASSGRRAERDPGPGSDHLPGEQGVSSSPSALTEDVHEGTVADYACSHEHADGVSSQGASVAALVSPATGTKVAAAFEELDEAIAKGRMRSFEEIARDMLRPMLSEWLDDNLPTLVERLVREEIERVARGDRR